MSGSSAAANPYAARDGRLHLVQSKPSVPMKSSQQSYRSEQVVLRDGI